MGWQAGVGPAGARPTSGVVHKRSPLSVAETVERLATAIRAAGARLFFVADHSGEAQRVGMVLRDTKLLVFGNRWVARRRWRRRRWPRSTSR